jgi:hypothetical protein
MPDCQTNPCCAVRRDPHATAGAILSEYAVIMGVFGLVVSLAIGALGPPLMTAYHESRQIVIAPVP